MEVQDINYNRSSAIPTQQMEIPTRPVAVIRSAKRLQFATIPTIQQLDNIGVAPPGFTPINSYTNIIVSPYTTTTTTTATTPPKSPMMIHSSTSLEVLMGDESSLPSACTSNSNTEIALTPKEQLPCIIQTKRRNSSISSSKTVGTGPEKNLEKIEILKSVVSTTSSKVSSQHSRTPTKASSILRKPLSLEKDSNSNIIALRTESSEASPTSTVKISHKSVQNDAIDEEGDSAEEPPVKTDTGGSSIKKTLSSHVTPQTESKTAMRKNYMTPRARSTASTSSSSILGPRHRFEGLSEPGRSSEMLVPLRTRRQNKFNMKSKRLPQLSSVISELKQKEVVFDRGTAIQGLKARILRGEKVTHEEIQAIRNLTLPPHERHLGYRLPWSTDLYCQKGLVYIATPNKQPSEKNSFGTIEDLRIPYDDVFTMEHYGRRQYLLNLSGFRDEDISLYLEGRNRLVIRAVRHDGMVIDPRSTPMSVTETILLPPDLPADNLRIVRKPSGTTIIEESWRF